MSGISLRSRTFATILILASSLLDGAARAQQETSPDAIGELVKIATAYKIEIVISNPQFPVKTTHGTIDGKNARGKERDNYTSLFPPEFCLYPTQLVQRAQLKRVVLCGELSFAGQLRTAIPDYEHDTLYLDVSRGAYSTTYLRTVLHHEFFHIIDYRDDGNVYKDERWANLNPGTFKYGNGGRSVQEVRATSRLTDKYPGFLNHYSTTGVEEDKAEMFANLIVNLDYVEARAKTDHVLRTKVQLMKDQLTQFCPEMNDKFWEKARTMKRDSK